MGAAVPLAFVALVLLGWLLAMRRFQLSRWTIVVAIAVLVLLLLLFFQAEDEDEPEPIRSGRAAASENIVRI
jgi:hydrogenase/urease accessory protein HupE